MYAQSLFSEKYIINYLPNAESYSVAGQALKNCCVLYSWPVFVDADSHDSDMHQLLFQEDSLGCARR